ncbi:hypothetical protein GCWU000324_00414 [Kingella oralis ATCC 51147]|uniref:Uncharacterized protein n=1 Tax=Kingella oralis ATCC 51147 TaxID=629741 RepID=C4GHS6_9NEIS|nr:hypothetical protein GCWU000324_00414 [Kingella oralis ATCC 51147]
MWLCHAPFNPANHLKGSLKTSATHPSAVPNAHPPHYPCSHGRQDYIAAAPSPIP